MNRKTPKSRRIDRDIFGTPKNRAKTWGQHEGDPKKNRKMSKQTLKKDIDVS